MRTLTYFLVLASFMITVPSFMAIAQDSNSEQTDDVFLDENSPMDDESYPPEADEEETAGTVSPDPNEGNAQKVPEAPVPHDDKITAKAEVKSEKKAEHKPVEKSRKTASSGGFRTTKADCAMYADAAEGSSVLTTVKGSKKIWTEKHADGWVKTFRKSGHGFMAEECFE